MEKRKLNKNLLKYCTACKEYFPNAWRNCPTCKKELKSFYLEYYVIGFFRKVIGIFKRILFFIIIIFLCMYGTYGIQKNERTQYIRGFNLLISKKFRAGWEEIKGALIENPLYKYVKSLTGGVPGKGPEVKKEKYSLRDVYFDINSKKNSALINSRVVFEGDSMGDFKVIRINIDSIDIETNGKAENIKFGRSWS